MKWHPFAEKFPLLQGDEWEAFKASIRKTGGNKIAVVYRVVNGEKEGIDGRNRFFACEELGLKCWMEEEILEDEEVRDFILVRNISRRHMTPELRRQIVAELRADGKSTRQIADVLGVGQSTVVRDLAGEPCGSPEPATIKPDVMAGTVTGRDGKVYPAARPKTEAAPAKKPESLFCERCRRVGPGRNCPDCERLRRAAYPDRPERQPGDDTEEIEFQKATEKARPKNGAETFDWPALKREVESSFGRLRRLIDALGSGYDPPNLRAAEKVTNASQGESLRKMLDDFNGNFMNALAAWQKELARWKAARRAAGEE